jgi:ABC-type multidrug transport system fused ATPase/permease subunit
LHLLAFFDYVYILEDGAIVDQGRFMELRQNSDTFRELWRHQEERTVRD